MLTRVFDAPRALVFGAWSDAEVLARWWGADGFTNPVCRVKARPGGAVLFHMRAPSGAVYRMRGIFHEFVEPEMIVLTTSAFEDATGHPRLKTQATVTFAEQGDQTILTLKAVVVRSKPEVAVPLAGTEEAWQQSLERLANVLAELRRSGQ